MDLRVPIFYGGGPPWGAVGRISGHIRAYLFLIILGYLPPSPQKERKKERKKEEKKQEKKHENVTAQTAMIEAAESKVENLEIKIN